MNDRAALRRLATFLHLLAAALFVGTIGELIAAKHYDSAMQLVPFALCALGLLAVPALRTRPTRPVVLAIRALMVVTAAGSLLGVYEHVMGNLDFVREVRRHADTMTVVKQTLQGADPILAPGVLAVAAAVTLAATYASSVISTTATWPARQHLALGRSDGRDWVPSDR
ncbi:MAG TPA: hypothetical protein VH482_24520 [Thermomicrobiales bacterium]|jgi:hypothetical protein